jgi:hypothetical protein
LFPPLSGPSLPRGLSPPLIGIPPPWLLNLDGGFRVGG